MALKTLPCSIEGCAGNAHHDAGGAKGFCQKHYRRLRLHGDPLGGRTPEGEPMRFIEEVALPHKSDDCLIWPFCRFSRGYAQIVIDGKTTQAHRYICELENGPAPTPRHQAAHSCGNGHLGCVAPKHLSWKTPRENNADKIMHGTVRRGERHGMANLTAEQAKEILSLKGKSTQKQIADAFGVSKSTICHIHGGRSWAWLHEEGLPHD